MCVSGSTPKFVIFVKLYMGSTRVLKFGLPSSVHLFGDRVSQPAMLSPQTFERPLQLAMLFWRCM